MRDTAAARRRARQTARTSLRTRPLTPGELSAGAVEAAHVSEGSVGEGHLSSELAAALARVDELEGEVAEMRVAVAALTNEVSYLRGFASGSSLGSTSGGIL